MKKKIKPLTFGAIKDKPGFDYYLTNCKTSHGFIYLITIISKGEVYAYIGKKNFSAKDPWETYTGSSKIVKNLIEAGCQANYQIIEVADTETLKALEKKYIYACINEFGDRCLNQAMADGSKKGYHSIRSKSSKRKS